jgi:UPF0755 protein
MYRRLRLIAALSLVIIVFASYLGATFYWKWATAPARPHQKQSIRLAIPVGATVNSVSQLLESQGIIRSARVFAFLGRRRLVKPGTYDLSPSEFPAAILKRIERGDVATIRVTFPEGFTLRQIAARLAKQHLIADADAFVTLTSTQGDTFKASFPLPKNLEGCLFPDTYLFPVGADDRRIAQRMLDTFDRLVARGKADEIRDSKHSLLDIINVAAMIEREAEVEADRAMIAGVIYNRLARNMKLEIDATVQYARGQHKDRLLFKDLEVDSPYNTYKVAGLPPGPICNPGLPSIEAAIHPEKHDYLYYVARPDGTHVFAHTFEEHEQNIAQIRHH